MNQCVSWIFKGLLGPYISFSAGLLNFQGLRARGPFLFETLTYWFSSIWWDDKDKVSSKKKTNTRLMMVCFVLFAFFRRTENKVRFHPNSVLHENATNKLTVGEIHFQTVQSLPTDWLLYEEMTRSVRKKKRQRCKLSRGQNTLLATRAIVSKSAKSSPHSSFYHRPIFTRGSTCEVKYIIF